MLIPQAIYSTLNQIYCSTMAPISKDEVLSVLKRQGPLVPNDIKRVIKGDTLIFGAILSELSSRGLIRITNVKKGGSPFYYVPGQEKQLEKLVEYLNPKDQKTLRMLKEKKVLQDTTLELFERVSLRQIKDFALPFKLETTKGTLLFWRYYLVSDQEAMAQLNGNLSQQTSPQPTQQAQQQPQATSQQERAPQFTSTQRHVAEEQPQAASQSVSQQHPTPQTPKQHTSPQKEEPMQPAQKKMPEEALQNKGKQNEKNEKTTDDKQQSLAINPALEKTPFYEKVVNYFSDSDISILHEAQLSKDREYDFVVQVPSGIGRIKMLCRARNKKRLNEGDVAPALLKAKTKDLPCLFLTSGDFTKKSKELIAKEYKGVIIKKI